MCVKGKLQTKSNWGYVCDILLRREHQWQKRLTVHFKCIFNDQGFPLFTFISQGLV